MKVRPRVRRIAAVVGVTTLLLWLAVTIAVEVEAPSSEVDLGGGSNGRALVLFHPSRDAGFSETLAAAVALGFQDAGLSVTRATLTRALPSRPVGYDAVAVISNTYYSTPDLPTLRYLGRARLEAPVVIGLMGGAGSTGRAERMLADALRNAGAASAQTQSFWMWRPNDERDLGRPNLEVASDLARAFAHDSVRGLRRSQATANDER